MIDIIDTYLFSSALFGGVGGGGGGRRLVNELVLMKFDIFKDIVSQTSYLKS